MVGEPLDLFSFVEQQAEAGEKKRDSPRDSPRDSHVTASDSHKSQPQAVESPAAGPQPDYKAQSQERLLERLRAGQQMLIRKRSELFLMDQGGIGTRDERIYLDGIDKWVEIEQELRERFKYAGCVMSMGHCDPAAVVKCLFCTVKDLPREAKKS